MTPDAGIELVSGRPDIDAQIARAEALIFDCDGTLVDTPALYATGWGEAFAQAGHAMEPAWYHARAGLSEDALMDAYEDLHNVTLDRATLVRDLRQAMIENMASVKEISEVAGLARSHAGRMPMAVASAGPGPVVRAALEAAGLLELFEAVVTVEDVVAPKPEPDLFLEAAARMKVPAGSCLVFEDSPQGFKAARAAGMMVVDVNRMRVGR